MTNHIPMRREVGDLLPLWVNLRHQRAVPARLLDLGDRSSVLEALLDDPAFLIERP